MPELPEVETIRLYLANKLICKSIASIDIYEPKQFIGKPDDIIGQSITHLQRVGKVLNLGLSNNKFINIHLKMSGQLLLNPDLSKNSHSRILIHFKDGSYLLFRDFRKFGWVKITEKPENSTLIDVLSPDFSLPYLYKIVRTNTPVKVLLMDQTKIAGIGNIYANDALFEAKIDPRRKSSSLSSEEVEKLYKSIKKVINEGIKYKGSSATQNYRLPDNSKGSYQHHFRVYKRDKLPCRICGTKIIRVVQAGRSTFYCPNCQK